MQSYPDPFVHHPALRGLIADPDKSFFRNFKPSDLDARMKSLGRPDGWRHSDDEVEAARLAFLADRLDSDLWIFAYGSLMWDPAFKFAEVRRARAPVHARKFILKDTFGARGSPQAPGLMAALDDGAGCDGLAFRIAKDQVKHESGVFWRRELLGHAYRPVFAGIMTPFGDIDALTVVANLGAEVIRQNITREEQILYVATGRGFMGTSLEYLENIASHFEALGIEDSEVSDLLADAKSFIAAAEPMADRPA
ncbi:MAG: gamma-glutamylcyclotransferase [Rhizobiaceae bacterium]